VIALGTVAGTLGACVCGNTAVITPESAEFVAVAPATVKKFDATPVRVYPVLGVSVIVAVYTVLLKKVTSEGDQEIVAVYPVPSASDDTGVASVTGAVTPAIAGVLITIAVITPAVVV
jgi:hypothetical protein